MVIGIRVFVHFFCFFVFLFCGKRVSCMIWILPRINGDRSEWHLLRFFGVINLTKSSKMRNVGNKQITPSLSGETGGYEVQSERSLLNKALI
jgi:hypothetical protein